MKKYIKFIPSLLLVLIFSCDDVLSEVPDNRTEINSAEKISELLVGAYPEVGYVPFLTMKIHPQITGMKLMEQLRTQTKH